MASSKKTTGNLAWIILSCVLVLVAPKFLFSQTETLTVELTTNQHLCEYAEVFGGLGAADNLPNYTKVSVVKYRPSETNPSNLVATALLQKPFDVLRIDPCTQSGKNLEILQIKLITKEAQTQLAAAELQLACTNCEQELTPTGRLLIRTQGADPQLVVKNLDTAFYSHTNKFLQYYQKLRVVALAVLLFCGIWQVSLLFKTQKTLLLGLILSNAVALLVFYLLYKKRFLLGFNLPFGDDIFQSGAAFMHLNMYSRYTDYVLYLAPLAISLSIFVGLSLIERKRR